MSSPSELHRDLRSWLREDRHENADRVLLEALETIAATPQRRAGWLARRFSTLSTYARYGLVAAAIVLVAVIGIGIYGNPVGGPEPNPTASPLITPSPSPSAAPTPVPDPIVGTWVAAEVTCEQQVATVEAAGFTAEQMTRSGWTCSSGSTNQYSIQFGSGEGARLLRLYDYGELAFPGSYQLVSGTTFEVSSEGGDYCLTYSFVIDGDQLTIEMTDRGCPATGEAPLNDQVAQTAIFETSSFTRQP